MSSCVARKHSGNTILVGAHEHSARSFRLMRRDTTTASCHTLENDMFRKATLGLIAAASLAAAALVPASASAHGFHGYWGHGWGPAYGFGGIYLNAGGDCLQQRMVETRRGLRLRTVNVCAYDVY
jgi:hypothetical protein